MATHPTYAPPSINPLWLTGVLLDRYPNHTKSKHLLESLANEYLKLWRLAMNFPERRVVAPGPIIAVQRVHWAHEEIYFQDCMAYFRRFVREELIWRGRLDIKGAVETVRSYEELYHQPPPSVWQDITVIYNLKKSHLVVVK